MGVFMSDNLDIFNELSAVDIENKVAQKGQFYYLSWATAVRELLKRYPSAKWEYTRFDGLPWIETKAGAFVECHVTVEELTRSIFFPVLDFRNQPVNEPDSTQVNKSMQRALAKCISLHGLGLNLWAGEDLDAIEEAKAKAEKPILSDEGLDAAIAKIQNGDLTVEKLLLARSLTHEQVKKLNEVIND